MTKFQSLFLVIVVPIIIILLFKWENWREIIASIILGGIFWGLIFVFVMAIKELK
jgi:hypothetical protein